MEDLNEDVLCTILTFLDVVNLSRTQRVCRDWNHLIGTNILEQKFGRSQQTKRLITNKQLRTAAKKYSDTKMNYTRSTTTDEQEQYTNDLEEIACSYGWPIGKWDVSNIVDFSQIFRHCSAFNEDLSAWDVSKGTSMCFMFHGATSFNQDLSMWDVASVINMSHMFSDATAFNQDLARWDTSNVTDMRFMFRNAVHFNQNLSSWDVSKVKHINGMFMHAVVFNQFLSGVQQRQDVLDMLYYDAKSLLTSWNYVVSKQRQQLQLQTELEFHTPRITQQNKALEESKEEGYFEEGMDGVYYNH